ncbi:NAD(P)-dependent glycerol-3-phosphate dehydrogenase [Candidatus Woesearchaeota archaeon]|nr:NAD(P)-dependent glycerol-3-phosphate dehydrogenase [Candidatus Woesearchaeota archaeon]
MVNKIAVIGSGSWGTTLAVLLGDKGYNVNLWVREKGLVDEINIKKENSQYLKDIKIPETVKANNSIKETITGADLIVNAVPAQFTRETTRKYAEFVKENSIIVNVSKGIELGTYKTMSQVLGEELKNVKIVSLSGPNHAEEVSKKIPTATVVASDNLEILETVKEIFSTSYFKVYPHDDMMGIEICGAIKNITAIATGICDGLGYGDNARASIITLGLVEMNTFGRHFKAKRKTFYGLAGVGDLIATCTSKHSRNRFVGEKVAEGKSLEEIKEEMHGMVAEGIKTTKAVYEFSVKNHISMPLTKQVYHVLYEKKDLKKAISDFIQFV